MLTLKLIFYGLVALVPSINGEGAMVVFPSAKDLVDSRGCEIPVHYPMIFQKVRDSKTGLFVLEELPLNGKPLPSYVEPLDTPSVGLKMVEGLATSADGGTLVFPSNANEAEDLSWIPEIPRLSFGSQDVRSECLVHPKECNVSLLVRTWQGDTRVCHLAHPNQPVIRGRKRNGRNNCGESGPILAYRFKSLEGTSTSTNRIQAVADAFMIKLTLAKTPTANLFLIFPDGSDATLPLEFEGGETVKTLVFANLPRADDAGGTKASTHHPTCHGETIDRHFYSYYDLGTTDPQYLSSLPLPHLTFEQSLDEIAMGCEEEVSLLEDELINRFRKALGDKRACPEVIPHSVEVCSTARFGYAALPSLRSNPPLGTGPSDKVQVRSATTTPVRPVPAGAPALSNNSATRPSRRVVAPVAATASPATVVPPPN